MPERHVVKFFEHRGVHVVEAAHVLFGFAAFRTRHKLVRHEHVPAAFRKLHLRNRHAHGRGIVRHRVAIFVILEMGANIGRAHEREHPQIHLAHFILERHRRKFAVVHRRHVHAHALHQASAKRNAFRRIVVPAQHEHLGTRRRKFHQKIVEHGNRLGTRHRLVVNIARNQHGVRMLLAYDSQNFTQYIHLFVEHVMLAHALAYM